MYLYIRWIVLSVKTNSSGYSYTVHETLIVLRFHKFVTFQFLSINASLSTSVFCYKTGNTVNVKLHAREE